MLTEVVVLVIFYGALFGLLYWRVRRNIHPRRSVLWGYLATLAILVCAAFVSVLAALMVVMAMANPRIPQNAIAGFVGFVGVTVAWQLCKGRLKEDPLLTRIEKARRAQLKDWKGLTRPPSQGDA